MSDTQELPEFIKETENGDYEITLNKPIKVDGNDVFTVIMVEPSVQDMLAAELQAKGKSDAVKEIQFFSNLCGLVTENIQSMKMKDYRRLQIAYNLFTD